MTERSNYISGGTLPPDHAFYITRRADDELLELCRVGTFAYILTARQMGKSSLMVQTARRLADEENIKTVIIDLTMIGGQKNQLTAEQWYYGILSAVHKQLQLQVNLKSWWHQQSRLSFVHRMTEFFQTILLNEVRQRIVIFIDEIDTTLGLPFSEDFFIALRSLYNARSNVTALRRLSFVLIGAATPSDLIRDSQRTPFNIGQQIDLTDWTIEEAEPLIHGLELSYSEAKHVLLWVMKWTGGHPYLTQRLLRTVADITLNKQSSVNVPPQPTQTNDVLLSTLLSSNNQIEMSLSELDIEKAVHKTFFGVSGEKDSNLQFVRTIMTRKTDKYDIGEILSTYREIYRNKKPISDEEQSVIKSHLKLSGIVRCDQKILRVRNPIYAEVFNERWISAHLPFNWRKQAVLAMRYLATALLVLALPLTLLSVYLYFQARTAQEQAATAQAQAITEQARSQDAQQTVVVLQFSATTAQTVLQQVGPTLTAAANAEQVAVINAQTAQASQGTAEARERIAATAEQAAVVQAQIAQASQQTAVIEKQTAVIEKQTAVAEKQEAEAQLALVLADTEKKKIENVVVKMRTLIHENPQLLLLIGIEAYNRGWSSKEIDNLMGQAIANFRSRWQFQSISSRGVPWSPDGKRFLVIGDNNTAQLTNTIDGRPIATLQELIVPLEYVKWSPTGKYVLTVDRDHKIAIWDTTTSVPHILSNINAEAEQPMEVAWSPDEQRLLAIGPSGKLRIWNQTGQELGSPQHLSSPANCPSPDNNILNIDWEKRGSRVAVGYVCSMYVVDTAIPDAQVSPLSFNDVIRSVAWNNDGTSVLIANNDGAIRMWDGKKGTNPTVIPVTSRPISKAIWSPDGERILTLSDDAKLCIFKRNGSLIASSVGHSGEISDAIWSFDGKIIVSGGAERTVIIWQADGIKELSTLYGHKGTVQYTGWSSDGDYILSSGEDQTTRVWTAIAEQPPTEPEQIIGRAKELTKGHQLTADDRNTYFDDPVTSSDPIPTSTNTP